MLSGIITYHTHNYNWRRGYDHTYKVIILKYFLRHEKSRKYFFVLYFARLREVSISEFNSTREEMKGKDWAPLLFFSLKHYSSEWFYDFLTFTFYLQETGSTMISLSFAE